MTTINRRSKVVVFSCRSKVKIPVSFNKFKLVPFSGQCFVNLFQCRHVVSITPTTNKFGGARKESNLTLTFVGDFTCVEVAVTNLIRMEFDFAAYPIGIRPILDVAISSASCPLTLAEVILFVSLRRTIRY